MRWAIADLGIYWGGRNGVKSFAINKWKFSCLENRISVLNIGRYPVMAFSCFISLNGFWYQNTSLIYSDISVTFQSECIEIKIQGKKEKISEEPSI